jgi:hypothetical protein
MKSFMLVLLSGLFSCAVFAADAPQLPDVKAVYLLPMGSGLDQFLANRLTSGDIFPVVADPARADAVFTDSLGEAFQKELDALYPPAAKPKPAEKDAKPEGSQAEKPKEEAPRNTMGRGKGNIFLVDTKTRTVIWSFYEKPKNSSAEEMNRIAGKIADRLKHDLAEK